MNKRNKLQELHSDYFVNKTNHKGILHISMRYGKCRLTIKIINKLFKSSKNILICYPNIDIKNSWKEEFVEFPTTCKHNIKYTTYASLHKHVDKYDLVILDEVNDTSEKKKEIIKELVDLNNKVIGLTGTISSGSKFELSAIGLEILIHYSVEEAIKDGILPEYEIKIHQVPLDNIKKQYKGISRGKNIIRTEKEQFDVLSWVMSNKNPKKPTGKALMMLALKRLSIIKNSISKHKKLMSLLKKYKDERVLVFTSFIERAEKTSTSHHSKNKEKENIELFKQGKIKHLSLIDTGKSGVTYKNLDRVVLDYTSSNAEDFEQRISRSLNNDYSSKIAIIDMIITDEPVEHKWIINALENISDKRITWIK